MATGSAVRGAFDDLTEEARGALLELLERKSPEELLQWAAEAHGERAAIVTSFQDTGCVEIDMAYRREARPRVLTVDSLRLHPETYELIKRVEARYGLDVECLRPDPERLERMVRQHGEYLFFDSKAKQEYCCQIRKVEPNRVALRALDVWITGLRRDQSSARSTTPKVAFVESEERTLLKIAPLYDWDRERVWEYIREHDVPYNVLYDRGYTSIGCIICSTPVREGEDLRAGRWRWQRQESASKECGIHTEGSGI